MSREGKQRPKVIINEFPANGFIVRAIQCPFQPIVRFDRDSLTYICRYARFNIDVYSSIYEAVRHLIVEELSFLWEAYASEDDSKLDVEAREVKKTLRDRFMQTETRVWYPPEVVETTEQFGEV